MLRLPGAQGLIRACPEGRRRRPELWIETSRPLRIGAGAWRRRRFS